MRRQIHHISLILFLPFCFTLALLHACGSTQTPDNPGKIVDPLSNENGEGDPDAHLTVEADAPMEFSCIRGEKASQFITILNEGDSPLEYIAKPSVSYIDVSPFQSEILPGDEVSAKVEVDCKDLVVGDYDHEIRILAGEATGSPSNITVHIAVTGRPSGPKLNVSPTLMNIKCPHEKDVNRSIEISNAGGGGEIFWNAEILEGEQLVTLADQSGSTPASLSVKVLCSTVIPGSYSSEIKFTGSSGGTEVIQIILNKAWVGYKDYELPAIDDGIIVVGEANFPNGPTIYSSDTEADLLATGYTVGSHTNFHMIFFKFDLSAIDFGAIKSASILLHRTQVEGSTSSNFSTILLDEDYGTLDPDDRNLGISSFEQQFYSNGVSADVEEIKIPITKELLDPAINAFRFEDSFFMPNYSEIHRFTSIEGDPAKGPRLLLEFYDLSTL